MTRARGGFAVSHRAQGFPILLQQPFLCPYFRVFKN